MATQINTISSARTRLMLTYLAVIMALSLGFSTVFYNQSVNEAKRNLNGQQTWLRDSLYFITPERLQQGQDVQLRVFKRSLTNRLVVLNFGMLALGSVVSYTLAKRSIRPLEEALTRQGRFTSDAAHELRTPLTAMKTEAEVALRTRSLSAEDAKTVLASNLEEISKLEALTAALLRLARSDEHVDKSNWQRVSLADTMQIALDRLAAKAKARSIKIDIAKTKAKVFGDQDQLVELFVTLIGNAIKYSHDGGKVAVSVKTGDKIQIDFKDEGVGIAEVDLPHIFERFYRADSARSREGAEGYGLGLSIAEAIVGVHGGEIKVQTERGKGSVFSVFLPIS